MHESPETCISYLVPCYNCGDYVRDAVTSLLDQPIDFAREVIVIDDGCDDTATIAAITACTTLTDVRVVRARRNGGAQSARNLGLAAARYPYILALDSDDRMATLPTLLSDGSYPGRAVEMLWSDPDVAFVHTMSRMFGDFDGLTISAYPCEEGLVLRKHHVPMPIVYRRTDALMAGGYDEQITKWQDWAFAVDLMGARYQRGLANRINCVPGPLHEYRVHTRWSRLSNASVSELAMTTLVVKKNLEYFRCRLEDTRPAAEIARDICTGKPTRLTDLLHMARYDLDQALQVARDRGFALSNPYEHLGIP